MLKNFKNNADFYAIGFVIIAMTIGLAYGIIDIAIHGY